MPAGTQEMLAFLQRPDAYPEAPARVEVRETHMSWVFLTDSCAWKLKKPVRYPFLDYRRRDRRRHFCEEEVRLNRRLAPEVYLGVVALTRRPDGGLALGGIGEAVDWLVRMRRLPADRMLDMALEQGRAELAAVAGAADRLAGFFAGADPVAVPEDDYVARFRRELALNRGTLHDGNYGLSEPVAAAALGALEAFLDRDRALLLAPLRAGRIVEGHGDLRPEHVFLGEPKAVIDCIEFDRAMRLLDPFEELAFLAMECERIPGGGWAGRLVLDRCAMALGGAPPARLMAFYTAFRASLRARLSLVHLQEPHPALPAKWRTRTLGYLDAAVAACARLAAPG